jgi:peptidyl-prolyl cis-trans isomerase B (cyclophilin B)
MKRRDWTQALLVLGLVLGCEQANSSGEQAAAGAETETASAPAPDEVAVLTIKDYGEIRIRFFPDKAPGHAVNFKKLARSKVYDGTTFHRIIPGFMIQGGDPNTKDDDPSNDGRGSPGYTIKAEFNDTPHKRGIVSMARANHPDSAGSQFFIVVKDSNFLDGKYTVFGEVISGMEVADQIVKQKRDKQDRPLNDIVIESVTIVPAG